MSSRYMMPFLGILLISATITHTSAAAQPDTVSHYSLDPAVNNYGLSFGNSRRLRGIRINLIDRGVEEVTGINLTLWKPGRNPDALIRGISFGLVAPRADRIYGLSLGAGGVIAESSLGGIFLSGLATVSGEMTGIGISGLAGVSGGRSRGIFLSGLANVTDGDADGIMVGGLANVCDGDARGINIGGLANVADGDARGISLGGLANVADGDVTGIMMGGMANVADGDITGISLGGLANVCDGNLTGISAGGISNVVSGNFRGAGIGGVAQIVNGSSTGLHIGGLSVVGRDNLTGISLSGGQIKSNSTVRGLTAGAIGMVYAQYHQELDLQYTGLEADRFSGINLHGIDIQADEKMEWISLAGISLRGGDIYGLAASSILCNPENLRGFSVSSVNYCRSTQAGLTVGLFNYASELHGIQIGLINVAGNNSAPFKILPLINASFD